MRSGKSRRTDRAKYNNHRETAIARGISWEFTFDEWLSVWKDSGKYELRGNKPGEYCMARHGDVGPYSPSNVYICEFVQNLKDGIYFKRIAMGPALPVGQEKINGLNKVKSSACRGKGLGWYFDKRRKTNPYRAKFRHRTIGCYPTAEDARHAYLQAVKEYERSNECF